MYNKPLTVTASLLLCASTFTICSCDKKEAAAPAVAPAANVKVTKLITKDVPIYHEWVGSLRGTEDAEIRPQVTGYLLSKNYHDGAYVQKGQTLFQIDKRPFEATLKQAEGRLAQYQAMLKKYELDVARYSPLVKTGSVSRKQLDDAQQQLLETQAAIDTAKAQINEAQINLKFTTITAPISGLAGIATPSIGNLLTPSNPQALTTISAIDPIRVDFALSENDFINAAKFTKQAEKENPAGTKFDLILANGEVYDQKGTVVAIDRNLDPQTGTISIVGHIPNKDYLLRPGMFVRVKAITHTMKDALLIPPRAIMSTQSAKFLIYLDENNVPNMQVIETGPMIDGMQVVKIVNTPNSKFNKDRDIVVEGIMQAARDAQSRKPVNATPYEHKITQPIIPSVSTQSFDKAKTPEGMDEKPTQSPATK